MQELVLEFRVVSHLHVVHSDDDDDHGGGDDGGVYSLGEEETKVFHVFMVTQSW